MGDTGHAKVSKKAGKNPTVAGSGPSAACWSRFMASRLAVDGGNRNDMKLVRQTLESIPDDAERPEPSADEPQGLCLEKGYDYDEVRQIVAEFGFTAHIRCRGEEAQKLKREAGFKARRWVVEGTHSWINRFCGC